MEFWGVEVKPGETVKCVPGDEKYLHLSQASLGEAKKEKGNENVPIFVKFNDQKLVLGTLSADKCAQIPYDLVFEKEFELSHSSKTTSVYFAGYKTIIADDDSEGFPETDSESEEDMQLVQNANGKLQVKDEQVKPTTGKGAAKVEASVAKPKVKTEELKKSKAEADNDNEDDDDDDDDDETDDDEDMADLGDESDDDDDEDGSSEEDEATPKKAETGKKRSAESASKTPAPEKKAKLVTPVGSQKTGGDGKKGVHTATPHPAKQVGKTPANNDKSKPQTPKSPGSVTCKSCSKTFNSDNALQAHSKAKHAAAK